MGGTYGRDVLCTAAIKSSLKAPGASHWKSKPYFALFKELLLEKKALIRMEVVLTPVQRKGRENLGVQDVEEDGGVEE